MLFDDILEILHALGRLVQTVWEKGLNIGVISAAASVLFAIVQIRGIKRRIKRYAPHLFADEPVPEIYLNNQLVIMDNQRRIMHALGVEPACQPETKENAITSTGSKKGLAGIFCRWSTFTWTAFSFVRSAARRTIPFYTTSIFRRSTKMKKWFKPDSLTVFAGIIAVAVNRFFGFEIDYANIIGAVILLLGYIKAHELVTVVRDAKGLPTGFRLNSRKTIFTAVAFLIVVADVAFKLNLGMDLVFLLAGSVTGYNYLESTKDVKTAEIEAAEARQSY